MTSARVFALTSLLLLMSACSGGTQGTSSKAVAPSPIETSQASTAERAALAGRIAFASDGRIFTVNVDGSGLQMIVDGNNVPQEGRDWFFRQPDWAASPAFSPDGTRVAFIRDLDVWLVTADGGDLRRLADIADGPPDTCAGLSACTPLGPSNLSWSPDGSEIAVMLQRVGGSGISGVGVIDVATGNFRRLKGRYVDSMMFMTVSWSADGSLSIAPSKGMAARIDPSSGDELPTVALVNAPWPATVTEAPDGEWLTGSFGEEGQILYGVPAALTQVATGLSPAFSPDAQWIAYFRGETIRVVRTDGSDDREVLDLAPLGGRDRLAASKDCFPKHDDSCSYRAPTLSWAAP